MAKTLVTGATGFTGGALARRLVQRGEQVVAFVRSRDNAATLERMGVDCRVVDIKNREQVGDQFTGIDRVYHIAAAYRAEHADRDEFHWVNVEGTRHLLDAAVHARIRRFVHCSTVGVQGQIDDPPADEDYRFNPGDHYQQTKLEGELLARTYFSRGLPGTVVRPVGIYGPGDARFLKLVRGIDRGYFVMIGSGRTLYHMTYIDDLIDGILLAGTRKEGVGEAFTVAGERWTSIRELVDVIADVLGKSRPRLRVEMMPALPASRRF